MEGKQGTLEASDRAMVASCVRPCAVVGGILAAFLDYGGNGCVLINLMHAGILHYICLQAHLLITLHLLTSIMTTHNI